MVGCKRPPKNQGRTHGPTAGQPDAGAVTERGRKPCIPAITINVGKRSKTEDEQSVTQKQVQTTGRGVGAGSTARNGATRPLAEAPQAQGTVRRAAPGPQDPRTPRPRQDPQDPTGPLGPPRRRSGTDPCEHRTRNGSRQEKPGMADHTGDSKGTLLHHGANR